MKSNRFLISFLILALAMGCGAGGGNNSNPAPKTLVSIAVTPANPSLTKGTIQQFTATGNYSDSSIQNLTASTIWSSDNPSVASISNTGTATATSTGTTTIAAKAENISGRTTLTVVADNVLPITVNGSLCAPNSYPNKPCVSVKICTPGSSTCQTINDILMDTGSYGLRIFQQALTVPLTQVTNSAGPLAECVQFGDGSSLWGSVQTASVILGNEPAVSVPIQVIDSTFGTPQPPSGCTNARQNPTAAGYSGILGVGLLTHDCGTTCSNPPRNIPIEWYYSCNGSTCSAVRVPLVDQVQNPVALLPRDNNGVIVQLPSVPLGGAPTVDGTLVLGIDTQPNNASSGVTVYAVSQSARFTTQINDNGNPAANTYSSFIDSGSNGLFFTPRAGSPLAGLLQPSCSGTSWFCPASTINISATNTSSSGSPSGRIAFQIGDADNLFQSINQVFVEIGGNFRGFFDWGLPFFFARNVYVGLEGKTSATLGIGPYWAY